MAIRWLTKASVVTLVRTVRTAVPPPLLLPCLGLTPPATVHHKRYSLGSSLHMSIARWPSNRSPHKGEIPPLTTMASMSKLGFQAKGHKNCRYFGAHQPVSLLGCGNERECETLREYALVRGPHFRMRGMALNRYHSTDGYPHMCSESHGFGEGEGERESRKRGGEIRK